MARPVDPGYGKVMVDGSLIESMVEILGEVAEEIKEALTKPEQGLPGEALEAIKEKLLDIKEKLEALPRPDNTLPETPEPKA